MINKEEEEQQEKRNLLLAAGVIYSSATKYRDWGSRRIVRAEKTRRRVLRP